MGARQRKCRGRHEVYVCTHSYVSVCVHAHVQVQGHRLPALPAAPAKCSRPATCPKPGLPPV